MKASHAVSNCWAVAIEKTPRETFTEDGDIPFINTTANYEIEAKFFGPVSVYAGAGVVIFTLADRFEFEPLGGQFPTEDTFGFEIGAGFQFESLTIFNPIEAESIEGFSSFNPFK